MKKKRKTSFNNRILKNYPEIGASHLYQRLVEFTGDAAYCYTFDEGRIIFANEGLVKILGLRGNPNKLHGKLLKDLLIYTEKPGLVRKKILARGEIHNFEYHFKTLKGDDRWVIHDSFISKHPKTGKKIVEAIVKDITDRKKNEMQLAKLNRYLRAITNCNKELIHASSEEEMLHKICEIIVRDCGYPFVWIGYIENNEPRATLRPMASAGFENGYLKSIGITKTSDYAMRGTLQRIFASGKTHVFLDIKKGTQFPFLKKEALKRRYAYALFIPLKLNRKAFGILNIYGQIPANSSKEEIVLLEELAMDLSYGILAMRAHAESEKAKKDLSESEEIFKKLAEQSPNMIFINQSGRIVYVNKECEKMGYAREEFYASDFNFMRLIAPESVATVTSSFRSHQSGIEVPPYEYCTLTKDGTKRFAINTTKLIKYQGSDAILGVVTDITERKKMEDELEKRKDELQLILDSVPAMIFYKDKENRILHANQTFADVMGMSKKDMEGKSCFELWPNAAEKYWQDDKEVLTSGCPKRNIVEPLETPQGTVWIQTDKIPDRDPNGNVIGIIGLAIDITARKQIDDFKDEIVRNVSHELRTPLHAMRESVSVLLEGLTGEINAEQRDVLKTAKSNLDRLVRLINNFLDFQRLESGTVEFNFGPCLLNDLVEQAKKTMEPLAISRALSIEFIPDPNISEIVCDRDRITQVILNLLSNAIKFTEHGGIVITTKLKKSTAEISIRDTGIGIHDEDFYKLFKKFEQLESGKNASVTGTGLGLAISKSIIERHHGLIRVHSEYQKGSTFSFTLPLSNIATQSKSPEISHG